eukprot:5853704-Pleurochrysis_carterae.AAC.5
MMSFLFVVALYGRSMTRPLTASLTHLRTSPVFVATSQALPDANSMKYSNYSSRFPSSPYFSFQIRRAQQSCAPRVRRAALLRRRRRRCVRDRYARRAGPGPAAPRVPRGRAVVADVRSSTAHTTKPQPHQPRVGSRPRRVAARGV